MRAYGAREAGNRALSNRRSSPRIPLPLQSVRVAHGMVNQINFLPNFMFKSHALVQILMFEIFKFAAALIF